MPDTAEYVNVLLKGRMPRLRQEVQKLRKHGIIWVSKSHAGALKTNIKFKKLVPPKNPGGVHFHFATSPNEMLKMKKFQAGAWAPSGSDHCVNIVNVGSGSAGQSVIRKLVMRLDQPGVSALAIAPPDVVNNPFVQQIGRGTRLGFMVAEPAKVTLKEIRSALDKWIQIWLSAEADQKNNHPPYLAIRQRLSDETSGRLNGGKIAKLFGLSTAEMGKVCNVSKQSIHANPTSKGIQEKLEPLVKAARGVLWCGGDEAKFKTWLNQPDPDFPEYDGKQLSPLDLIRMGHAQVIADKVQNLLTGHPS